MGIGVNMLFRGVYRIFSGVNRLFRGMMEDEMQVSPPVGPSASLLLASAVRLRTQKTRLCEKSYCCYC